MSDQIRIDRWLWCVRLSKSRSAATNACNDGKVRIGDEVAKPARRVRVGDVVEVKRRDRVHTYRVERIIDKRVGAPIAVECYVDLTPELPEPEPDPYPLPIGSERPRGAGRPTKRERRAIDRLRRR